MRYPTVLLTLGLCLTAAPSLSAEQYVYPSRGQGPEKQARDEAECARWATRNTGFDPARAPPPQVSANTQVTGSGARAAGAVGGAIIAGASGGDAGSGALAGAAVGGLAKRARGARAARQQNEANAAGAAAGHSAYLNARAACLGGRGYEVK